MRSNLTKPKGKEGIPMAKQGMKRPSVTHTEPQNELSPVPEIQGKAKHGKKSADRPAGPSAASGKSEKGDLR